MNLNLFHSMENKNEKKTMRINFRYNSIKKILTRDTSNDNSVKKDEYSTTISRKINKIKPTQSGKQVSFSKKIEQIPLSLAEIGKLKLTPTKYTVNSAKNKTVTITVTAKELIEETYLTVKYPEGKTYKIALSVVELEKVEGKDKSGNNFILNEGITVNQSVLDTGYIAGYTDGTFGPLKNITREEFGVILARILDYKGVVDSTDYIYDVTAEWSKNSIAELAAMGVVDKNIAYRPKDYITRYEVAEMLYNVVDLNEYSTSCPLTDLDNYSVIGRKIAKCWNAGLIAGYSDGTFGGSRNITRAEAVVLVNRIFYENMNTNKVNVFPDVPMNIGLILIL